jgi:hypothetical protein
MCVGKGKAIVRGETSAALKVHFHRVRIVWS